MSSSQENSGNSDTNGKQIVLRKRVKKLSVVNFSKVLFRSTSLCSGKAITSKDFIRSNTINAMEEIGNSFQRGLTVSFSSDNRPTPAPLLVEDPPSSDNASDLEDLKNQHLDPSHLDGSSSNFGNFGARSAPGTPQGLLGSSPGSLVTSESGSQPCSPPGYTIAIQRSPSHNVFTKYDKGSLKQLSTSTPTMTAQARSPEPPSPKIAKEDKLPTTSKARQKKFHRHFQTVDLEEKVLNYYSCALIGDILLQGHLYITKNYFAFYSNVFGYVTKLLIPLLSVEKITKEKTARIIPNAVGITTAEDKHVFGSLISRDNTYRLMNKVWDAARNNVIPVETELIAVGPSECSDSSKSSESGNELTILDSRAPSVAGEKIETQTHIRKIPPITPTQVLNNENASKASSDIEGKKTNVGLLSKLYAESITLPKQHIILCVSAILVLLLFISAVVMLYRIGKVQQKYNFALQDNHIISNTEDVYGELLQWQAQLHSKSAGAVHNFLDANLDQIAKVRQSLEALSTLLTTSENNNNNSANQNSATEKS